MLDKDRTNEVDKLLSYLHQINQTHHKHLINVISSMKRSGIKSSELKLVARMLQNVTEDYVNSVIELVEGIKTVSFEYFKKMLADLEEEDSKK